MEKVIAVVSFPSLHRDLAVRSVEVGNLVAGNPLNAAGVYHALSHSFIPRAQDPCAES